MLINTTFLFYLLNSSNLIRYNFWYLSNIRVLLYVWEDVHVYNTIWHKQITNIILTSYNLFNKIKNYIYLISTIICYNMCETKTNMIELIHNWTST